MAAYLLPELSSTAWSAGGPDQGGEAQLARTS